MTNKLYFKLLAQMQWTIFFFFSFLFFFFLSALSLVRFVGHGGHFHFGNAAYVGLLRPPFVYTIRPLGQANPNIAKAIHLRGVKIHQNSKRKEKLNQNTAKNQTPSKTKNWHGPH